MGLKEYAPTRTFFGAVSISGAGGFYKGKTLGIKPGEVIKIGRDRDACVLLYPPGATEISRVHCILRADPGQNKVSVTDCSKNGTYLENGERMEPGKEYFLADGEGFYLAAKENSFIVRLM